MSFYKSHNVVDDICYLQALALLDIGARESLTELVQRSLTKLATQPEGRQSCLDDTLLL